MAKNQGCTIRTASDGVPILEFRGKYLMQDWGLDFGSKIEMIDHTENQIIFQKIETPTTCQKFRTYTVRRLQQFRADDLPQIYIKGHFLVRELAFKLGIKFQATHHDDLIILNKVSEQQVQQELAQKEIKKLQRRIYQLQTQF